MEKQKRVLMFAPAEMSLSTSGDGTDYRFGLGGTGALSAAGLTKLGVDCLHCARIGDDYMGKLLRHIYDVNGISKRYLVTMKEVKTGFHLRTGSDDARRRAYFAMDCEKLSSDMIEEAFNCLPDAVYLEESYPAKFIHYICSLAKEKKIPLIYRATGLNAIDYKEKDYGIDTLLLTEREAAQLAGMNTYSISNLAINLSIHIPARYYLINLWHRGIYLYDGMHKRDLKEPYGAQFKDTETVMAAFVSGYIAEYLRSGEVDAGRFVANLAAAAAGTHAGGENALPDMQQVRRLAAYHAGIQ